MITPAQQLPGLPPAMAWWQTGEAIPSPPPAARTARETSPVLEQVDLAAHRPFRRNRLSPSSRGENFNDVVATDRLSSAMVR